MANVSQEFRLLAQVKVRGALKLENLASLENLTQPNGNILTFLVKHGRLWILHLLKSSKIKMLWFYTTV